MGSCWKLPLSPISQYLELRAMQRPPALMSISKATYLHPSYQLATFDSSRRWYRLDRKSRNWP